jgi:hypothetical protein
MAILQHTNGNFGGNNPVYFCFTEDVLSFVVNPATRYGSIGLKNGLSFIPLYASPDSVSLECKEEDTPAGIKYKYEIKMLVPKDRSEVEIALELLNNRKIILYFQDKNNVRRYIGTVKQPLKKIAKLSKPASPESFNGWEVIFYGEFSSPPCYTTQTMDSGGGIEV